MATMNPEEPQIDRIQLAVEALIEKDISTARKLLIEELNHNPRSENAWMIMSSVVSDEAKKRDCLARVLQINPNNQQARQALSAMDRKSSPSSPSSMDQGKTADVGQSQAPSKRLDDTKPSASVSPHPVVTPQAQKDLVEKPQEISGDLHQAPEEIRSKPEQPETSALDTEQVQVTEPVQELENPVAEDLPEIQQEDESKSEAETIEVPDLESNLEISTTSKSELSVEPEPEQAQELETESTIESEMDSVETISIPESVILPSEEILQNEPEAADLSSTEEEPEALSLPELEIETQPVSETAEEMTVPVIESENAALQELSSMTFDEPEEITAPPEVDEMLPEPVAAQSDTRPEENELFTPEAVETVEETSQPSLETSSEEEFHFPRSEDTSPKEVIQEEPSLHFPGGSQAFETGENEPFTAFQPEAESEQASQSEILSFNTNESESSAFFQQEEETPSFLFSGVNTEESDKSLEESELSAFLSSSPAEPASSSTPNPTLTGLEGLFSFNQEEEDDENLGETPFSLPENSVFSFDTPNGEESSPFLSQYPKEDTIPAAFASNMMEKSGREIEKKSGEPILPPQKSQIIEEKNFSESAFLKEPEKPTKSTTEAPVKPAARSTEPPVKSGRPTAEPAKPGKSTGELAPSLLGQVSSSPTKQKPVGPVAGGKSAGVEGDKSRAIFQAMPETPQNTTAIALGCIFLFLGMIIFAWGISMFIVNTSSPGQTTGILNYVTGVILPLFVIGFGLVLSVVMGYLVYRSIDKALVVSELTREGRRISGTVLRKEKMAENQFTLVCQFILHPKSGGEEKFQFRQSVDDATFSRISEGSPVAVIYLSRNPSMARVDWTQS